ncbi:glucose-1-phosphate adenylyltransferase [Deinococcus maricopensis]|uniref:Glucose-1-phosphate adenylyltransferase n=1 Tax=Deinococcus maricopensis (strain DSM 21211 / LMG 22137 / NRRL B-23946 / LB-34) TaxID=709986 RepID=E8U8P4_DEIML|nr:glucose-1-phosphate adenylyltransferase [Deinococcus maricopensis]ADV67433.1 Glucose-1-phosphate adenylyltransferase [Deinococcus maricopensis DSM 21211]
MTQPRVLGMVLAGGQGTRLSPLTLKRSKPAVPFGSKYRIIDFALNNFINSGIFSQYVLIQYKAQSLTEHIQRGWRFGTFLSDYFITLVPAQMYRYEELGPVWYRGTADAVYQNLHLIDNFNADYVAIFSGDHIYKMNIAHMLDMHRDTRADVTIAAYPMPLAEAQRFGVMQVDDRWRVTDFQEKVPNPPTIPGKPDQVLTSMGNYIFSRRALEELLERSIAGNDEGFDFGKDVIPRALRDGYSVQAYDFHKNPIPGQLVPNTYWRDVGTLDAYYDANMDLISVSPEFDMYNEQWPLRTSSEFSAPTKFVHEQGDRRGQAFNSLVAGGTIISGATVRDSVVGRRVHAHSYALVEGSVVFDNVQVGRHSHIHRAIIDKDVIIPPGTTIGLDHEEDRARGFTVTDSGVVVVPKSYTF